MLGLLSKLLTSLMRNYLPKRPSDAPLNTLYKLYDVPVGFVNPTLLMLFCFIYGRRRVAVAQNRMTCLVLTGSQQYTVYNNTFSCMYRNKSVCYLFLSVMECKLESSEVFVLVYRCFPRFIHDQLELFLGSNTVQ